MSDSETTNQEDQIEDLVNDQEEDESLPDELTVLKAQATKMGISFSPRIGVDALREKIKNRLEGRKDSPEASEVEPKVEKSSAQLEHDMRKNLTKDAMRLIRLRITNLNPNKKELKGEIFTVANRFIGNVKKFISYGEVTEDGYHVPYVIYKQLKDRKFLDIRVSRDKKTGQVVVHQRWVPEFALEVLPQLTNEELKELAAAQAAAGGV